MSFKYLNEDQIDSELKCMICDEPFQSPMNCKFCGNTYCQKCILKWCERQASCPSCREQGNLFLPVISRVVLNQLNRLLVQCQLCEEKNIQRSNFHDHVTHQCPKQTVSCTDQCGWQGYRENLLEHLKICRQKTDVAQQTFIRLTVFFVIVVSILLFRIFQ